MLSRVAESIYWMSRYVERAENVARFIDVHDALTVGAGATTDLWDPLIAITGDKELFDASYGRASRGNVVRFLTFDATYPNSILSCLAMARENGRTIRDHLSAPMWEELNKFFLMVKEAAGQGLTGGAERAFYNRVKLHSHLLAGLFANTMAHGERWHFGRLGRFLERADKTSRILDVKYFILLPDTTTVGSPVDVIQWSALLHSTDCATEYHRQHGRIAPEKVVSFLMLDPLFPRSIRHCLTNAETSLHAISGCPAGTFSNEAEKRLGRLRSELDYSTVQDILTSGLHEYVDELQRKINDVGSAIHGCFFGAGIGAADAVSDAAPAAAAAAAKAQPEPADA